MAKSSSAPSWTKTYFRDVMGSGELLWNLTQREGARQI